MGQKYLTTNTRAKLLPYNIPEKMEKQTLPKFCFVLGGRERRETNVLRSEMLKAKYRVQIK